MHKLMYASGALYCEITDELKRYFYEDGTLKTVERFSEGKLSGESTLYWPNGQVKRRVFFKDGIRNGLDQMKSPEGILLDEGHYELGKPVGVHRRYNKLGSLIEEIEYLDLDRFNLRSWNDEGELWVDAKWIDELNYLEKAWDRFENKWIEKKGRFDGKKLIYL